METAVNDAARLEPRLDLGKCLIGSGEDAMRRTVDRCERDGGADKPGSLVAAEPHGDHAAARQPLHQLPARRDQTERVGERKHPGETRGDKFADAVPDESLRGDPPAPPQLRQRVFDRKDRRLRGSSARQPLGARWVGAAIERSNQVETIGAEDRGTPIELMAEYRKSPIEPGGHIGVLRPLSGEHEDDRWCLLCGDAVVEPCGIGFRQCRRRLRAIAADQAAALRKMPSSALERKDDVGQ